LLVRLEREIGAAIANFEAVLPKTPEPQGRFAPGDPPRY